MRVLVVYDCLFPFTVGGAERWYVNLAQRLADEGHEVTYLTLRQWDRGTDPGLHNVRVLSAGPPMGLYTAGGRRRILPPLLFGAGVLWHLLRHGRRYEVLHTASFPYFSLLAAGLARPLARFHLVVDWHEVWSRAYWREYLGPLGGKIGHGVQLLCARLPQRAFCFSRLHAERLRREGLHGEITVLTGEYGGSLEPPIIRRADPVVVFAGRLIPEKRAPLGVAGVSAAARRLSDLRGVFFGDGPERGRMLAVIEQLGAGETISSPGFVEFDQVDAVLGSALCMLLPSRREGYGMIVVEAAARATPSIVIADEDNAATELIEEGVNGYVVAAPDADAIADAIVRVYERGMALRESTASWFTANADRLSLESSLRQVLASYRDASARE